MLKKDKSSEKKVSYKNTLKSLEKAWLWKLENSWKSTIPKRKYSKKIRDPELGIIKFSENYWFGKIFLSLVNLEVEFVFNDFDIKYKGILMDFITNQIKFKNRIIKKIYLNYNEIFEHILDEFPLNKQEIDKKFNLFQLIVDDHEVIHLIFDCEWDEHGIEIKIKNTKIIGIGQIEQTF